MNLTLDESSAAGRIRHCKGKKMNEGADPTAGPWQQVGALLAELGTRVQSQIIVGRDPAEDSREIGFVGGDVVYAIDKRVEALIVTTIEGWPDNLLPLTLVAEGFGKDGKIRVGRADQPSRYRLLIDPIDGTRGLMYDKRSAWFLAAAAPDRGDQTTLSDVCASVLVELPTSKQGLADVFVASRGAGVAALRRSLETGSSTPLTLRTSGASTLLGGFGQVSNFFPGTKQLAASLMEHIAKKTLGELRPGEAQIFDDQYISTGGQLVELMTGRDRFCCDLRPLFFDIIDQTATTAIPRGLECHPYDMAGLFAAKAAGVIVTDGYGNELDAPFDVHTGIHWIGYGNSVLRNLIEPVVLSWLREHQILPTGRH